MKVLNWQKISMISGGDSNFSYSIRKETLTISDGVTLTYLGDGNFSLVGPSNLLVNAHLERHDLGSITCMDSNSNTISMTLNRGRRRLAISGTIIDYIAPSPPSPPSVEIVEE